MICPHCKVTQLIVVKESYYCPKCSLYIGSVKSDYTKQHAISNKVIDDAPIKDNLPPLNLPQKKTDEKSKVSKIKRAFQIIVPVLFFGLILEIWFILATGSSYVDVGNFCKIDITDSQSEGEVKLVIGAINVLKKNDAGSYKSLCNNINEIGVNGCNFQGDSCYFKGSKSMYLSEVFMKNDRTTDRAMQIRKYAEMSREFWSTR